MTQPPAIDIAPAAHNILLDDDGLTRLGSLVGALTQGHSSVALASGNIAWLQHHALALTQAVREQAGVVLTVHPHTELEALLEQFNALSAQLPVRAARQSPKRETPTHVWLMQSAEQYPAPTLLTLQRLVQDFPALKLRLAFVFYGDIAASPLANWPNLWCWPLVPIDHAHAQALRQRAQALGHLDEAQTWLARCGFTQNSSQAQRQAAHPPTPPASPAGARRWRWRAAALAFLALAGVGGAAWRHNTAATASGALEPKPISEPSAATVVAAEKPQAAATQPDTPPPPKAGQDAGAKGAASTAARTATDSTPPAKPTPPTPAGVATTQKKAAAVAPTPEVLNAPKLETKFAIAVLAKPDVAPPAQPQVSPPSAPNTHEQAASAPTPEDNGREGGNSGTKAKAASSPSSPAPALSTLSAPGPSGSNSQIKGVATVAKEPSSVATPGNLDLTARDDALLPTPNSPSGVSKPASEAWIQALPNERWLIEHSRHNSKEAAALWTGSHPGLEHARVVVLPAPKGQNQYVVVTGPFVDQAAARRYADQIQNTSAPVFLLGADLKRQASLRP